MATKALNVNGKQVTLTIDDPEMPLLYALRDNLALKGPRFGCGLAQCGACTVHVDGKAVRSCVTPLSSLKAGQKVVTLEGLGTPQKPHPVQAAFIAEQAVQCGYCINGMIMESAAFLATNKKPTEAQIKQALANNLCRCGTHARIVRAVTARSRHRLREAPMNTHFKPSRRHVIKGGGALVVSFSLAPQMAGDALAQAAAAAKPLAPTEVDSYLAIDAKGAVTLYSGKVDLGTGVRTALAQMCAEELDVPFTRVTVVQGDTALTPDQGTTWGSLTIQAGGIQIRQASAAAKSALLDEASKRLGVPKEHLSVNNGVITGLDMRVSYAELIGGKSFSIKLDPTKPVPTKDPNDLQDRRQVHPARRHPRQGHRHLHLHAGLPRARHAARARGASAGHGRQARERR